MSQPWRVLMLLLATWCLAIGLAAHDWPMIVFGAAQSTFWTMRLIVRAERGVEP